MAREMRMPLHGSLGIAVMSSRTLGEAMDIGSRFLQLRLPQMRLKLRLERDCAVFQFISDTAENNPLAAFILDTLSLGLAVMGEQLVGQPIAGAEILRRGPEPRYYRRFADYLPVPVRFEQHEDALRFPALMLEAPVRFSDDLAARISREQCEQALLRLRGDATTATRVRRVIETSHPFPPGLQKVASALCMSERTLKRRLQEEATTFQEQVDTVRLGRAENLLANTRLPLAQVADALGYADAANFTRAFKRWTGVSPSRHRAKAGRAVETELA